MGAGRGAGGPRVKARVRVARGSGCKNTPEASPARAAFSGNEIAGVDSS